MTLLKKLILISLTLAGTMTMTACWESDTENAIEDVGESVEKTAEDLEENVKDPE